MPTPAAINPATLPAISLAERQVLPDAAAIYFVLAGGTVLYVAPSSAGPGCLPSA